MMMIQIEILRFKAGGFFYLTEYKVAGCQKI